VQLHRTGGFGAPQVMCVQEAEGVAFFMTSKLLAYGRVALLLLAVCVCVSLFLTPFLFWCVFQEKADSSINSSDLSSDIQVSRPTMQCISAFRPSHTCSHHYNSLLQHAFIHDPSVINQLPACTNDTVYHH